MWQVMSNEMIRAALDTKDLPTSLLRGEDLPSPPPHFPTSPPPHLPPPHLPTGRWAHLVAGAVGQQPVPCRRVRVGRTALTCNWSRGSEEEAVKGIDIDLLLPMLNHSMRRAEATLALTKALSSDGDLVLMSLPAISEHCVDIDQARVSGRSGWC